MPIMDGFMPYEKIRKVGSKIRIFFMTAFGVDHEAVLENSARLIRNGIRVL
jgi:CheY-like chemotaxis protein